MFETERLNLGRLLTRIGRETDVRSERGGKGPRFSVPSRDVAKVVAICECLCYNYKIIKERGIALFFVRALGRAGVVLGALLSLALLILRRAVEESGVREWAFLPAFDGGELERRLLALDGVAFASVTKRGTRVYVDVHAEREGSGLVDIPSEEVKASVAASVTRVVVRSGTAEVSYGDVVKPGLLVTAIGSGARAAEAAHAFMTGRNLREEDSRPMAASRLSLEYFSRVRKDELPAPDGDYARCMSCGSCRDCGMCRASCPEGAISRVEIRGAFAYVSDPERCIGCGVCAGVCPCGVWTMHRNEEMSFPAGVTA